MDIRKFFEVQTSKNGSSLAGSTKKSNKVEEKASSSTKNKNNGLKRKSSKTTDSGESPAKEIKRKTHRKKSKNVIEDSDSEEEPLPTKIRKKSKDSERKAKKQKATIISSDEEDALPSRLQKSAKKNGSKEKEPEKKTSPKKKVEKSSVKPTMMVTNVSDYFGTKPVERTMKKTQKRKERSEDVPDRDVNSNSDVELATEQESQRVLSLEQPAKKAKKSSLDIEPNTSQELRMKQKDETKIASKTTPTKLMQKIVSVSPSKSEGVKTQTNKKPSTKTSEKESSNKTPKKNTDNGKPPSTKTPEKTEYLPKETPKSKICTPNSSDKKLSTSSKYVTPEKTKPKLPQTLSDKKPSTSSASETLENVKPKLLHTVSDGKISPTGSKSETPETPKTKSTPGKAERKAADDNVVPSSLERKSSAYRSFMMREGPQALGSKEIPRGSETCLAGKIFVVTGVLESIERDDAVDLIKRHGGKVTQAVSKKTNYLVLGRDPGLSKLDKAEKLGTKQINEDELFDMIRASQPATKQEEKTKEATNESSQDLDSSQFTEKSESQTSLDELPNQASYSQSSHAFSSASSTPATQTSTASPLPEDVTNESLLWVDKYKPKILKNIIGQHGDKSNVKKLLRWLHDWHKNLQSKPIGGFFSGKEDGSIFKAALLSGPPGVGKTTSANLVCKEAGFSFVEFNASDSRSKKTLEQQISELLDNRTMDGYFRPAGTKSASQKHVLIMDEVDGMAGNEDRGGMQELINLIKSTKIPIICMCNDRNSQKVRSLANYCFDLRFHRPKVDQIKAAMMTIAFKENLTISPAAMEKIVVGANQDVRQVLHNLSMWTSKQKSITYDEAKTDADRAHKDIKLGPFDVTRKIFSFEESSKMKIQDQFSLFFNDYSLIPLFSQENYLQVVPYSASGNKKKTLKCVSDAAESFCNSDLVEKCIRGNGSWNLLPLQAFFSCVLPGSVMRGRMGQRIDFPCWLGKNSTTAKNSRILQDLVSHAQLSISGSKNEMNLDYIPHLRNVLSKPLIDATTEDCSSKVSEVIEVMDSYHFLREDWEGILDVGQFQGNQKPQDLIASKVKAAFTRTFNKASHLTPYSSNASAKKKAKKSADLGDLGTGEDAEETGSESDDDVEHLKVKRSAKGKGKTPAESDGKQSRGKGTGKGRGKNKK